MFYVGSEMVEYLENAENWAGYLAFEKGLILYEMKSDNIIEIVFSWLKEARSFITPYFVTFSIINENIKRIDDLRKSLDKEIIEGLTPR